jgi:hypothetical protein
MNKLMLTAALAVMIAGCGNSTGPAASLTGTFIGSYTATADPGVVYQGVLQLTQNGANVTGTFTTNAGRSATMAGTVSGSRVTGSYVFTDGCAGSASTTADVTNGGTELTGNYSASDCLGTYSGGYVLTKQ